MLDGRLRGGDQFIITITVHNSVVVAGHERTSYHIAATNLCILHYGCSVGSSVGLQEGEAHNDAGSGGSLPAVTGM